MWLYFALLISSIAIPLVLSFDKKLQFYKRWLVTIPSIVIIGLFFIIGDVCFTKIGVWGFNPRYHLNILVCGLPVEEWLFFIVIPYASIFLHESVVLYFPQFRLSQAVSRRFTSVLIVVVSMLVLFNIDKIYTLYHLGLLVIVLIISLFDKTETISRFYMSFLVILIPFIAVNAILTGSFIDEEVVWYNNDENLGIRLFTIPIEDFGYGFSLILFNLLLISKLKTLKLFKF